MNRDDVRPRRRVLRAAAATMTASTALVAGCVDQGDGGEEDEAEAEEGTGNGQEREGEEADDGDDTAHEDESDLGEDEGDTGASESGEQEQNVDDAESWADVDEILLITDEDVWIGQEPSLIADEENPTLELTAGTEYEIGYENRDGDSHTLALRADDDERDSTEVNDEEGERQWLTVEASDDLSAYRCEIHPDTMKGDIEVSDE